MLKSINIHYMSRTALGNYETLATRIGVVTIDGENKRGQRRYSVLLNDGSPGDGRVPSAVVAVRSAGGVTPSTGGEEPSATVLAVGYYSRGPWYLE